MEDKELRELEEFTLEDIIREFSDHPETVLSAEVPEAVETPTEVTEEMPEDGGLAQERRGAEREDPFSGLFTPGR